MIAQLRFLTVIGIISLAGACSTQHALNTPVGPGPLGQTQSTANGFLTVYSLMKTYPIDEETWYRVHTDYGVYDANGQRVMSVRNAASYHDPIPKTVELPAGNYTIQGWGDGYALYKVPVVIQAGRVTTVNLEANTHQLFQGAKASDMVRAYDGIIVGWEAK